MEIRVNGINLFYEQTGQGPALILLHGNGENHYIFDRLSKKLREHFTLYALDSRNHGKSDASDDHSYTAMSKDLEGFIDKLNLAPARAVGFSDGAVIALIAALRYPTSLKSLALLGVNLSPNDFKEDVLKDLRAAYAKTQDPLIELMLKQPSIKLSDLRTLTIPVLIVSAENDVFKPESFTALSSAFSRSRHLIMKGHSHDSYLIDNDLLFLDLLSFFEE